MNEAEKQYRYIIYKKRPDKILEIVFNRPEKLNSIHDDMRYEIVDAVDRAEMDDDINVIIFKGNGEAFSAGHDLTKVGTYYGFKVSKDAAKHRRPSQRIRLQRDRRAMTEPYRRILNCWKVTIAQIHGVCLGGANFIQAFCDISIAADNARIGHPEQRLGFSGTSGLLTYLVFLCGPKKAQEILLTGEKYSGTEAAQMGLVNRAVPESELEATVERYAQRIAKFPRDGIAIGRATKHMVYETLGIPSGFTNWNLTHTLFTNIRWEEDEYNFFKERRDAGAKKAFKDRDAYYSEDKRQN